jgi:hypothetical protein
VQGQTRFLKSTPFAAVTLQAYFKLAKFIGMTRTLSDLGISD